MKIVIDVSEDTYRAIKEMRLLSDSRKDGKTVLLSLLNAVKIGDTLPKGHGRLIDGDKLLSDMEGEYCHLLTVDDCLDRVEIADTIIRADDTIICPNCGSEQYIDKEYCMDCGARLDSSCEIKKNSMIL